MRILMVHNAYKQAGGEDSVVANEAELLRSAGLEVELMLTDNNSIKGAFASAKAAFSATYSWRGRRLVGEAIERFGPDIVHVHNFFPAISPSLFDATRAAGVPSVWTLHNFRVTCANGLLFRHGEPCENCVGRSPLPAIRHRCYRGSLAGSAAVAASIAVHRKRGTWQRKVDRFIALNHFCRERFIAAGLPPQKIVVKPNFVPDPGEPRPWSERRGAVYVGRLSAEKGVRTLITAWRQIDVPLTIVGDGPLRPQLEAIAPANVSFSGHRDKAGVYAAMAAAQHLIVPSEWYENFPMTVVEAMAHGTPVIASRIGSLTDILKVGVTGLHFTPGDVADLVATVVAAFADPDALPGMGRKARAHYQEHLSPEANLTLLEAIYADAIAQMRLAA